MSLLELGIIFFPAIHKKYDLPTFLRFLADEKDNSYFIVNEYGYPIGMAIAYEQEDNTLYVPLTITLTDNALPILLRRIKSVFPNVKFIEYTRLGRVRRYTLDRLLKLANATETKDFYG